jgi:uncharacterized membrane protein
LWLLLLEVTVVRTGFQLNVNYHFVVLQVIWAIGWSMILLAPFVYLPPIASGVWGLLLIVGHNALDGIHAASLGSAGALWNVVHEQGAASERMDVGDPRLSVDPVDRRDGGRPRARPRAPRERRGA